MKPLQSPEAVLVSVLAAVCVILIGCFWPGKDPAIAEKEDEAAAEEAMVQDVEILAPDCLMQTIDGRHMTMRELYNRKPVCLVFWMPWSDASKAMLPAWEDMYRQYGRDVYFVILSLGSTVKEAQALYHSSPYTMPFYTGDIAIAGEYNVYEVPQCIMIARGGAMRERHTGSMNRRDMEYMIVQAMQDT